MMSKYVYFRVIIYFILCFVLGYLISLPRIVLNGLDEVVLEYGEEYQEQGAYLSKFNHQFDVDIIVDNNLNVDKIGEYKVNYKCKLGFLTITKTRIVKVVDSSKPVITLVDDNELFLCPNGSYEEAGYKAYDNYDGDITNKVIKKEEKHVITYTVSDSSGNTESVSRQISRVDVESPVITLKGTSTVYIPEDGTYTESGYTASDNCDGDLTSSVKVSDNIDTSKKGEYKVQYEVVDSNNNKVVVTRKVIVYVKTNNVTQTGEAGSIYLTFDDGPSNYTSKILDILKKYNVKATFFVTNKGSDAVLLRAYNEGHTIGLHTNTHKYSYIYSSMDNYFADLNAISDRVKRITGYDSKFIRFPGGSSNTVSKKYSVGIMTALTSEVLNRGYKYFDWNISGGDAGGTTSATGVYNNVVKNLSKKRVNMVLLHDTKSHTANAIESIIVYGLNNGYSFKAIDDDTAMVTQKVNN